MSFDPRTAYPQPPFPQAKIAMPGEIREMDPQLDHGEMSYTGSGRLAGKAALITGADSGIGRAVALVFAREGADVVLSYLDEHDDAKEAASWVERARIRLHRTGGAPRSAGGTRATLRHAGIRRVQLHHWRIHPGYRR